MNEFDQAARYAARRLDYAGFLHWLLGAAFLSCWRWAGWLDSQAIPFPGEQDRRCDTVASFTREKRDGTPLAVVVEFMSRTRSEILWRLAEYKLLIRRHIPFQSDPLVRYDVIGVVVNLTGELAESGCVMAPPNAGEMGLWTKGAVRNLSKTSAVELLAKVAAGEESRAVLAWVPLLADGEKPETVTEWVRLASLERNDERRADLGGLARVFAELAGRLGVWKPALEGWNVERSTFLQERETQLSQRVERQTALRSVRSHLLLLLASKAEQELPPELVRLIEEETDLGVLERWFGKGLTVTSLEGVRDLLTAPAQQP